MSVTTLTNNHIPGSTSNSYTQQMNQKWQEIVSPKVYVRWGVDDSETREKKANYKLGELIEKINSFHEQGKQVCIFIGRTPYEKLPSDYKDTNEAKENEVWIGLDICFISPEGCQELKNSPGIDERMYLWFDCNQQEGLHLIKGLFDKVVVDNSTAKGFDNDFVKRFSVFLRNSKSELIFPNPLNTGMPIYPPVEQFEFHTQSYLLIVPQDQYFERDKIMVSECYRNYTLNNTKEKIQSDKNTFAEETYIQEGDESFEEYFQQSIAQRYEQTADDWVQQIGISKIKSHLEGLYHSVEHHAKKKYPYSFNVSDLNNSTYNYFIVRDYKTASNS